MWFLEVDGIKAGIDKCNYHYCQFVDIFLCQLFYEYVHLLVVFYSNRSNSNKYFYIIVMMVFIFDRVNHDMIYYHNKYSSNVQNKPYINIFDVRCFG